MRILFTGGGTMGSVSPLLAIHEALQTDASNFFRWIGTKTGPERLMVEEVGISYVAIPSGKLRRYFDWRNFTDPFLILGGFFISLWVIWRFKPDVVLTAGSFVSVPTAWAAKVLKKRVIVHQMDLKVGLANKLMVPTASRITVAFPELRDKFPREKVIVTGNPTRQFILSGIAERARGRFQLERNVPTVLVMGGGLGSSVINEAFVGAARDLTAFCQVIHLTGRGDQSRWTHHPEVINNPRYHAFEFMSTELADAYAVATVVVSRAGLASLTELSVLGKPSVIIPIPNNQQVENVDYFNQRKAVVYVQQQDLDSEYITNLLQDLLEKKKRLHDLSTAIAAVMPKDATATYVKVITDLLT